MEARAQAALVRMGKKEQAVGIGRSISCTSAGCAYAEEANLYWDFSGSQGHLPSNQTKAAGGGGGGGLGPVCGSWAGAQPRESFREVFLWEIVGTLNVNSI